MRTHVLARRRRKMPSSTPTPSTLMASPPRWKKRRQWRSQVCLLLLLALADLLRLLPGDKFFGWFVNIWCLRAEHPSVISVFPNRAHKLHTTRSWEFLGMEKGGRVKPNSIWAKARFGQGVIIGNLDTGTCLVVFLAVSAIT